MVRHLQFFPPTSAISSDPSLKKNLQLLLISSTELRSLVILYWQIIPKLLLDSDWYGKEGGKNLIRIEIYKCLGAIKEPFSVALNHLRQLPALTTIKIYNELPTLIVGEVNSPEIGFAKVANLDITTQFHSNHPNNLASLFPAVVNLRLSQVSSNGPDFTPFLLKIQPQLLESMVLHSTRNRIVPQLYPIDEILPRFKNLSSLEFEDQRPFHPELIAAVVRLPALVHLSIRNIEITLDEIQSLIFGLKRPNLTKKILFSLKLKMHPGKIGIAFKDGIQRSYDGSRNGWDKPRRNSISRQDAEGLIRLAEVLEVKLEGTIPDVIKIEEAFEKEIAWLEDMTQFMKNGKEKENVDKSYFRMRS